MLTEKDYCDYETSRELKELGFIAGLGEDDCGHCLYDEAWHDQIDRPLLYEAQKWLREEKKIYITVGCPLIMNEDLGWSYEVCDKPWNGHSDDDCLKASGGAYDSYEEALSKGIKQSVKILKEK